MLTPPARSRLASYILVGTLGVLLAALAGRLVYIWARSGETLTELASRNHYMRLPIRPTRGSILDARMRPLALSVDVESVFADPGVITDPAAAAAKAAPVLGLDRDALYRTLTERPGRRFVWLSRRVDPETARAVRGLGLYGIGLATEGQRQYPSGMLACHVLGFCGSEEQGLEGLERLYDKRLSGREGMAWILTDRQRRPIWSEPDQFVPVEDGQHLVLTIDSVIQAAAEEALDAAVAEFRAAGGSAVVMDPRTGAILAMANCPRYDPNRYQAFPAEARRNRAVTDTAPPGSCGKPFLASAAIEHKVARFGEEIFCENGYWAEARLHDAGHSYGKLTFELVQIKSSNIGMAKLGVRLGNRRLHEALDAFGFGRRTGILLPGESPGLVFPLSKWTKYSTTRVPFGQEFAVTPLQLATAFSSIANGGRLLKPKIIRGVLDSRGQVVLDLSKPDVVGRPISERTARDMIEKALVGVVEIGTGKAARIPGYRIFGKTGTAQGVDPETGQVSHTRYIASFVAGVPADDPQLVVLVSVTEPDKSLGYYGGTVAAPAVRRIMERAIQYLGIEPSEPVEEGTGPTWLVRREGNP